MKGKRFNSAAVDWKKIGNKLADAKERLWEVILELQKHGVTVDVQDFITKADQKIMQIILRLENYAGDKWGDLHQRSERQP